MLCNWIDDVTYMKRPEPPARRTLMPCGKDAVYVIYGIDGLIEKSLCQFHYDGKVYRRESVDGYEKSDPSKFYGRSNEVPR